MIDLLQKQIEVNRKKLLNASSYLFEISHDRRQFASINSNVNLNMLPKRQNDAVEMVYDFFENAEGLGA